MSDSSLPKQPTACTRHCPAHDPPSRLIVLGITVILTVILAPTAAAELLEVSNTSSSATVKGSLAYQVDQANTNGEADIIWFSIRSGKVIEVPSTLSLTADETEIHGDTADSSCSEEPKVTLQAASGNTIGFDIAANQCVIRGLKMEGFTDVAVRISSGAQYNRVGERGEYTLMEMTGNGAGVRMTGAGCEYNAVHNCHVHDNSDDGIQLLSGACRDTVGLSVDGSRSGNDIYSNDGNGIYLFADVDTNVDENWIDGNDTYTNGENGILLSGKEGASLRDNWIVNNHVGTDASGLSGTPTLGNDMNGIHLNGIGVLETDVWFNVVVDNGANAGTGIYSQNALGAISGHMIGENLVGVDKNREEGGNTDYGIKIEYSAGSSTTPGDSVISNVVGCNGDHGIYVESSNYAVIVENTVGLDGIEGVGAIRGNAGSGIALSGCTNNHNEVRSNTCSGNVQNGIELNGTDLCDIDIVENIVGLDETGQHERGNEGSGIVLTGVASDITVTDNTCSGNDYNGIVLTGADVSNNLLIWNNTVGLDVLGEPAPNGQNGIVLADGAHDNGVDSNTCSGNTGSGILLTAVSNNTILSNSVGLDANRTIKRGNGGSGILLAEEASSNQVWDNNCSGNQGNGITLSGDVTFSNTIENNTVGLDGNGDLAGNGGHGIELVDGAKHNIVTLNVCSGNTESGIMLSGEGTYLNLIDQNTVGLDEDGEVRANGASGIVATDGAAVTPISGNTCAGNSGSGIELYGHDVLLYSSLVTDNRVGWADVGGPVSRPNEQHGVYVHGIVTDIVIDGNEIGGNVGYGVYISGDDASGTQVVGNTIGTDATGMARLGNEAGGVFVSADDTQIGDIDDGNTICYNEGCGIVLEREQGTVTQNRIYANLIKRNASHGVHIRTGCQGNSVGDRSEGAGNIIEFNDGDGVRIGEPSLNPPTGNTVLSNSIYDNEGFGIHLEGRANDDIPPPIITAVGWDWVMGVTNLDPRRTTLVQVFYDTEDEGKVLLGEVETSAASWFLILTSGLPATVQVTATNTSIWPDLAPPRQTSEFSTAHPSWCVIGIPPELFENAYVNPYEPFGPGGGDSMGDDGGEERQGYFAGVVDGPNRLYLVDRRGVFESVDIGPLAADGKPNTSAAGGDFDNDGDPDVYLVHAGEPNQLFENDGELGFTEITPAIMADAGLAPSAAWVDVDTDGYLDLMIVDSSDRLTVFHNDGASGFSAIQTDISLEGCDARLVPADHDLDGDPDLYIANAIGPNLLLENLGGLAFADVTTPVLAGQESSQAAAWGDSDNDGDLDLYVVNDQGPNRLLRNLGNGEFEQVADPLAEDPGPGRSAAWGDFDKDGDLDLYLVNFQGPNRLLLTGPQGLFVEPDSASTWRLAHPGSGMAAAMADYDRDGDLDLFLANRAAGEPSLLFGNLQSCAGHWLQIDLVGVESNRDGIGARVEVTAGNLTQMREVGTGNGFLSQPAPRVAVGLGEADVVDLIRVFWPSGTVQEIHHVMADRIVVIEETHGAGVNQADATLLPTVTRLLPPMPNPMNPSTLIRFELARAGEAKLAVYNPEGRLVRLLAEGRRQAGSYSVSWDGLDARLMPVGNGVYFVRLQIADERRTQKVMVVK